jgi:hypothetical protein
MEEFRLGISMLLKWTIIPWYVLSTNVDLVLIS